MTPATADVVRVESVAKSFGAVTALVDVSLHLGEGECLGLIGDNGAGKSTLIKILSGYHRPDSGALFVNGEEATLRSVDHARSLGIDTVYLDLALIPTLSVAHNYVHVLEVCDRVNLLQHGRIALDRLSSETSAEELTELVAREYRRQRDDRPAQDGASES